ncbi:globin [Bradyrhizobium sp. 200]|uniref:globin n=1 Tax=Bradyrhizobium sp. 200 TaxID=2782665 RepID=UPI001FFF2A46|nr:globin [Bradyrhizobium sp. 200]UPJ53097.1 globin [Bradyrhizobium sp. 200]
MILSPNRAHFRGSCAGAPRELFVAFFNIIAQTLREIVGADWSDEIEAAWRKLLGDIESLVAAQ